MGGYDMSGAVDAINLRTMRSKAAVAVYAVGERLQPREAAALQSVLARVRGQPILDLGVGAGRTAKPLLAVSSDYLGIDYSPEMVAHCRARYPNVRFEHGDARELRSLAAGSFGLVVFSCNGICMVAHDDRLKILREALRVLKPGGVLLFTTYNQDCDDELGAFKFPEFALSANPVRLGVRAMRFVAAALVRARNWLRYRKHNLRTAEYSMINDVCHDYGTMLYYISLPNQRRQLEACGFERGAVAFDHAGKRIETPNRENDYSIVAFKPMAGPMAGLAG